MSRWIPGLVNQEEVMESEVEIVLCLFLPPPVGVLTQ